MQRRARVLWSDGHSLEEKDVTGDGNCLLYSIAFSLLLPLLHKDPEFKEAVNALFGSEGADHAEHIKQILLTYDGSKSFIEREDAKILRYLIADTFRKQLVRHMEDGKDIYRNYVDDRKVIFKSLVMLRQKAILQKDQRKENVLYLQELEDGTVLVYSFDDDKPKILSDSQRLALTKNQFVFTEKPIEINDSKRASTAAFLCNYTINQVIAFTDSMKAIAKPGTFTDEREVLAASELLRPLMVKIAIHNYRSDSKEEIHEYYPEQLAKPKYVLHLIRDKNSEASKEANHYRFLLNKEYLLRASNEMEEKEKLAQRICLSLNQFKQDHNIKESYLFLEVDNLLSFTNDYIRDPLFTRDRLVSEFNNILNKIDNHLGYFGLGKYFQDNVETKCITLLKTIVQVIHSNNPELIPVANSKPKSLISKNLVKSAITTIKQEKDTHGMQQPHIIDKRPVLGLGAECIAICSEMLQPENRSSKMVKTLEEYRDNCFKQILDIESDSLKRKRVRVIQEMLVEIIQYIIKRRDSFFSFLDAKRPHQISQLFKKVGNYIDGESDIGDLNKHFGSLLRDIESEFIIRSPTRSDLYRIVTATKEQINAISANEKKFMAERLLEFRAQTLQEFKIQLNAACNINKKKPDLQKAIILADECIKRAVKDATLQTQLANEVIIFIEGYEEVLPVNVTQKLFPKQNKIDKRDLGQLDNLLQTDIISNLYDNLDNSNKTAISKSIQYRLEELIDDLLIQSNSSIDDNDIKFDKCMDAVKFTHEFFNLNRVALRVSRYPFIKKCFESSNEFKNTLNNIFETKAKELLLKECALLRSNNTVYEYDFNSFETIISHLQSPLTFVTINGKNHPNNTDPDTVKAITDLRKHYLSLLSQSTDLDVLRKFSIKNIHTAELDPAMKKVRDRHIYIMLSSGGTQSHQSITDTLKRYGCQITNTDMHNVFYNVLKDFCIFQNGLEDDKDGFKRIRGLESHSFLYAVNSTYPYDLEAMVSKVEFLLDFYQTHYTNKYYIPPEITDFLSNYFTFLMKLGNTKLVEREIIKYKENGFTQHINELDLSNNTRIHKEFTEILAKTACVDTDISNCLANYFVKINDTESIELNDIFNNDEILYKHHAFILDQNLRNGLITEINKKLVKMDKRISSKWVDLYNRLLPKLMESAPSNSNEQNLLKIQVQTIAYIFCTPKEQGFLEACLQRRDALFSYLMNPDVLPLSVVAELSAEENLTIQSYLNNVLSAHIKSCVVNNTQLSELIAIPDNAIIGFNQYTCLITIYEAALINKDIIPAEIYQTLASNTTFVNFISNYPGAVNSHFLHQLYNQANESVKSILLNKAINDLNTKMISDNSYNIFSGYEWLMKENYQNHRAEVNCEDWDILFVKIFTDYLNETSVEIQDTLKEYLDFITQIYCSSVNKLRYDFTLKANIGIQNYIDQLNSNQFLSQFSGSDISLIVLERDLTNCDHLHKKILEKALTDLLSSEESKYERICNIYLNINESKDLPKNEYNIIDIKQFETYIKTYLIYKSSASNSAISGIEDFLNRIDATTKKEIFPHLYTNSKFFKGTTQPDSQNNLDESKRKISEFFLLLHCVAFKVINRESSDFDIESGLKCVRSTYIAQGTAGLSSGTENDKFRYDALEQFSPFSNLFPVCFMGSHAFSSNSRNAKKDSDFRKICRKEYANESVVTRVLYAYYSWLHEIKEKLEQTDKKALDLCNKEINGIKKFMLISNNTYNCELNLSNAISPKIRKFAQAVKKHPSLSPFISEAADLLTLCTLIQAALKASADVAHSDAKPEYIASIVRQNYILSLLSPASSTIEQSRRIHLAYAELISLIEIKTDFDSHIIQSIAAFIGLQEECSAEKISKHLLCCMEDKENIDVTIHTIQSMNAIDLFANFQNCLIKYLQFQIPTGQVTHIETIVELLNDNVDAVDLLNISNIDELQGLSIHQNLIDNEANYADDNVKEKYKICALLYAQVYIMIDSLKKSSKDELQYSLIVICSIIQLTKLLKLQLTYLDDKNIKSRQFVKILNEYIILLESEISKLVNLNASNHSPFKPDITLIRLDNFVSRVLSDIEVCSVLGTFSLKDFVNGNKDFLSSFKESLSIDWKMLSLKQQDSLFKIYTKLFDFLKMVVNESELIYSKDIILLKFFYSETQMQLIAKISRQRFFEILSTIKKPGDLSLCINIAAKSFTPITQSELDKIPTNILMNADIHTLLNFRDLFSISRFEDIETIKLNSDMKKSLHFAAENIYKNIDQRNDFIDELLKQNNIVSRFILYYPYSQILAIKDINSKIQAMSNLIRSEKYYLSGTECIKLLNTLQDNAERSNFIYKSFDNPVGGFARTDTKMAEIIIHELKHFYELLPNADFAGTVLYNLALDSLKARLHLCTLSKEQQDKVSKLNVGVIDIEPNRSRMPM